ncbi:MAG: ABC exporter membrane fusion protein [Scytonema sp. PMC 1069.18]|nr:ABC exporter membrane fusion protein [Scytonema sp. PMC 1069.18]MEC4881336.1 ABC exporter membrane fusion protein [Scytonema sp. PMC 1070.18]
MNLQTFPKSLNRYRSMFGLIVLGTALSGATAFYSISQFEKTNQQPAPVPTAPVVKKVIALGRLQPEKEVIRVSAPLTLERDRVAELLVKRGDRVQSGQAIAVLDSRVRLQSALLEAQQQLKVAQAKLAQVKAGAKTGEISAQSATIRRLEAQLQNDKVAQQSTISRLEAQLEGDKQAQQATIKKLEAELNNATAEYQRYQTLYKQGAISASLFDSKRLNLETSSQQLNEAKVTLARIERTGQQQLNEAKVSLARIESTGKEQINEAKATLNRIAEVRPVDVQASQAEVDTAAAAVKQAETDLNQAYIRAPMAGRILEIYTRPGESITSEGIADLAQTDDMEVVAEVYQTDISKIRVGQQAVITSESFSGELQGTVNLIGLQVSQQKVFSTQPGENLDRRVIEVRIRLRPEDSQKVAGLTNLQVNTAIKL